MKYAALFLSWDNMRGPHVFQDTSVIHVRSICTFRLRKRSSACTSLFALANTLPLQENALCSSSFEDQTKYDSERLCTWNCTSGGYGG